ncbi:hypothetical protein A3F58_02510 [Candidatus Roizmanbacteria bacterium RIFCSPHIGHO2_12_FULL_37_9b]|uniref:UPF0102 protein A3C25_06285 n=1 Tax=Candidatus Roizmanbacteria bacterium RIFCSPHIGHO2_02_FULL_38_11 TaxID=1802039 RepID=A0A1F7GWS0_9BACT|nr:MAG: hypothetical protein A3C25_06285 [Candidatus Roizmanbacteria bacterium RIFCSPHIGHO2_02_FULL_38_11]OGK35154.1 MAG: hypothetical protein A3F58_02510 [Candidatus Roizmanbacteria bacterium RIFCSPHIGHO2_12_FULL_37_9b]
MLHNIDIGKRGESIAKEFLRKKGYQILEQNFYTRWGEIDIIAKKNKTITFFEVKTRIGDNKGKPYESVGPAKIRRLYRPIQYFLLQNNLKNYKLSLDVISIVLNEGLSIEKINHFENVYI